MSAATLIAAITLGIGLVYFGMMLGRLVQSVNNADVTIKGFRDDLKNLDERVNDELRELRRQIRDCCGRTCQEGGS